MFWTGSPKALLKVVTILHNIIWVKYLSTGPQKFGLNHNLVVGEALRVLEKVFGIVAPKPTLATS